MTQCRSLSTVLQSPKEAVVPKRWSRGLVPTEGKYIIPILTLDDVKLLSNLKSGNINW